MAELEISVVPMGTGSPSVSGYIAECIKVLRKEKVSYTLNSCCTAIEGDLPVLFRLARKIHEAPFRQGVRRVVTTIKIDDRRDKKTSGRAKLLSVKEKLHDR